MSGERDFDVAIVGASAAGCTAARLFGQAGARVALIEQRPDPEAYKVACTHAILSSGSPTIERLGLAPLLAERGAVRTVPAIWTPYGGWIRWADAPRGWGVTRMTLDPLLRRLAAETSGVELMTGRTVGAVLRSDGAGPLGGVEVADRGGRASTVRARLVVGADGRHSAVARLAGFPARVKPNNRFVYFAYWRGVRPVSDHARVWLLDPDAAAAFPNEDDLTLLAVVAHASRFDEFSSDREGSYLRALEALTDAPDLSGAERISKLIGMRGYRNVMHPAAHDGVALVGDAALTTDPLWGVGLSWALQSAEWLVDATADALVERGDLDAALARYRRRFLRELGPHHVMIAEYSSGRRMHALERATYRAGATDPVVGRAMEEVGSRRRTPLRMLDPRLAPRTVRALVSR